MSTAQGTHYLKLRLDGQIILIALEEIHIVLPIPELQKVPHDRKGLEGVLNFHGQALPVYHLSELIDAALPNYDLNTPIIIAALSSGLIGLLVSDILEVVELPADSVEKPPVNQMQSYVTGLFENEKWSGWILSLEKLFEGNV